MIKVKDVCKSFGKFRALDNLNINVGEGSIYGLVGTNGAGKTTIIKNIVGIQKPDSGEIFMDGLPVYECPKVKEKIGYVADEMYFMPGYSLKDMATYQAGIYSGWNEKRYKEMVSDFGLNESQRLSSFSKGMQKQAAFILAMSIMPKWLILDEPIDGLDPVVRLKAWKHIIDDVADRGTTVLVSSHNLREMEGYCDHIGIIANGKMVIERDLEDLKSDVHKVQVAFVEDKSYVFEDLNILHKETRGSVDLMIIRDDGEKIRSVIGEMDPAVFDMLPLSLEEIFIYELGGNSDEIGKII